MHGTLQSLERNKYAEPAGSGGENGRFGLGAGVYLLGPTDVDSGRGILLELELLSTSTFGGVSMPAATEHQ